MMLDIEKSNIYDIVVLRIWPSLDCQSYFVMLLADGAADRPRTKSATSIAVSDVATCEAHNIIHERILIRRAHWFHHVRKSRL